MSYNLVRVIFGVLAISNSAMALGPGDVNLGTAGNFAIVAESGISNVPTSAITGDICISPAGSSSITGFALTLGPGGTYSTSTQVTGKVYAANYNPPTPSKCATAVANMTSAYTAAGALTPTYTPTSGSLGGLTLTGGVYKYKGAASAVTIPTSVTFSGSATDTWVMQVGSTLGQTASTSVVLAGGALWSNIFWVVPGAVTIAKSATFNGVILGGTSCAFGSGAVVNGRILCQTAVTLIMNTVTS